MSTALSQATAVAEPAPDLSELALEIAEHTSSTRHLQAVPRTAPRRRPRMIYAFTAVAGAVIIGAAQLGISIASTQTTYEIRSLTEQQRSLDLQAQALQDDVAGLGSPQVLAANAEALDMVVGDAPTYLRLSDAKVFGTNEAVTDSSVDALRNAVPNALVSNTPLLAAPDRTLTGQTAEAKQEAAVAAEASQEQQAKQSKHANLPPSVTDGLPVPETH